MKNTLILLFLLATLSACNPCDIDSCDDCSDRGFSIVSVDFSIKTTCSFRQYGVSRFVGCWVQEVKMEDSEQNSKVVQTIKHEYTKIGDNKLSFTYTDTKKDTEPVVTHGEITIDEDELSFLRTFNGTTDKGTYNVEDGELIFYDQSEKETIRLKKCE